MADAIELPCDYTKLSPQERRIVRERYAKLQGGDCHHCERPLSGPASKDVMACYINRRLFPESFFKYPVHLHHCHDTHLTIGAVHCHCNAVLWQYHGE